VITYVFIVVVSWLLGLALERVWWAISARLERRRKNHVRRD